MFSSLSQSRPMSMRLLPFGNLRVDQERADGKIVMIVLGLAPVPWRGESLGLADLI
jgi:hypothetical protein